MRIWTVYTQECFWASMVRVATDDAASGTRGRRRRRRARTARAKRRERRTRIVRSDAARSFDAFARSDREERRPEKTTWERHHVVRNLTNVDAVRRDETRARGAMANERARDARARGLGRVRSQFWSRSRSCSERRRVRVDARKRATRLDAGRPRDSTNGGGARGERVLFRRADVRRGCGGRTEARDGDTDRVFREGQRRRVVAFVPTGLRLRGESNKWSDFPLRARRRTGRTGT